MVRGSPNPRHFGLPARLRKARKQLGLTRKGLGQKVGRDPKVAAKIEARYASERPEAEKLVERLNGIYAGMFPDPGALRQALRAEGAA